MIRRLFTIISVLSLLVCICIAMVWVRSYVVTDRFGRDRVEETGAGAFLRQDRLVLGRGGIGVIRSISGPFLREQIETAPLFHEMRSVSVYPGGHTTLGFGVHRFATQQPGRQPRDDSYIVVPLWPIFILSAILPFFWVQTTVRNRRRARREKQGRCLQGGYDLRAHKPGDLCPECGTPIPASSNISKPEVSP